MHTEKLVEPIKSRPFREPNTAGGKIDCDGCPEEAITTHCFKEKTHQTPLLGAFQVATWA